MLGWLTMLQYEKLGYAYGYKNLDRMSDWLYDAFDRVSQASNKCFYRSLYRQNERILMCSLRVCFESASKKSLTTPLQFYKTTQCIFVGYFVFFYF